MLPETANATVFAGGKPNHANSRITATLGANSASPSTTARPISMDNATFATPNATARPGVSAGRPNFGTPSASVAPAANLIAKNPANVGTQSAGVITTTATTSRQIQFGLKLIF